MLEYVLFHRTPFDLFVEFLKNLKVEYETETDGEIFEIRVSEDITRRQEDEIEDRYDELMNMNHELFHAENPSTKDNFRMATIMITLKSGQTTAAHIRPDLLGRVLDTINEVELNEIVTAVVEAVENPDDRSYCQKVRAGDIEFDGEGTG